MTEITVSENPGRRKPGFGRARRHSLRMDMTPMVDLGFLLITFFIYTSTMSDPTAMPLDMPNDKGAAMPTKQSGALTLIPTHNQEVYYYEGAFAPEKIASAPADSIRGIIMDKKNRTTAEDLFVIIKPTGFSNYRNVVDVLDEMIISRVERYALVKISPEEESVLMQKGEKR